jgi:hypothetical protein
MPKFIIEEKPVSVERENIRAFKQMLEQWDEDLTILELKNILTVLIGNETD